MSHAHTRAHSAHADGKLSTVANEVSDLNETLQSSVRDITTHGKRTAQAAGVATKDAVTILRDSALDVRDRVGKSVAERPFTSIAVAAAAGAAVMGLAMMWRRRG